MLIRWDGPRRMFWATCPAHEQYLLDHRWIWSKTRSRWESTDWHAIKKLWRYASEDASAERLRQQHTAKAQLDASSAADGDVEVAVPFGKTYRPFQRAAIAYALARKTVLIGDEMGLGKTIEAIGVVNADPFARRILIVCPATLRLNWAKEWRTWNVTGIDCRVVTDRWRPLTDEAIILSYDSVRKWHAELTRKPWDIAIFDEAHYLKNADALRTKHVMGVGTPRARNYLRGIEATRTLMLTGTPILNRPAELWTLAHKLDPNGLGRSKSEYDRLYVEREDLLDELHERLRSSVMVRRLKADVLADLPPKTRQLIPLDVAGAEGIVQREQRDLAAAREKYLRFKADLMALPSNEAAMKLNTGRQIAMTEIARIRHETAVAKLPAVIEHLRTMLAETAKCVVFGHHHDVIDGLLAAFPKAVVLDGRMNGTEKDASVKAFQNGDAPLFIGSIRAAGLGITLTAASTVLFAELDWTPAAMLQAEDRCHRIGQRENVLVQHLVLDGSIDAKMSKMLVEKQQMLDQVLDGIAPATAHQPILAELLEA